MKPKGALPPGSLTLTTARSLVLALATKSIDSSGERASELGVLPGGALGSIAVPIVSMDLPASVSITLTVLRLALATNRILPPLASSISLGCSSVVQWPVTLKVSVLTTATLALLQRLT